jgi:hypothetical protein
MAFDTAITELAEYIGSEVRRVENKIPTEISTQPTNSNIITGNGRPDKPDTTDGKITGREPNGTFYNSTNGAGVGAYLWHKQNNKWVVISADTGSRQMRATSVNIKEGVISLRRVNNTVECSFSKGRWDTISFYGSSNPKFTRKNHAKRMDLLPRSKIPQGFRATTPVMLPFYSDDGDNIAVVYVGSKGDDNYIELRFKDKLPTADLNYMRMPVVSWITDDPFPETLSNL